MASSDAPAAACGDNRAASGEDTSRGVPPQPSKASVLPHYLVFPLHRPYASVREDRTNVEVEGDTRLRFMINSRTWRNSWLLQVILTDNGWVRVPAERANWDLWWCAGQANTRAIRELLPSQRVNKFPKSSTLTLKAYLHYTVAEAAGRWGAEHFAFMPETYVLPTELEEFEAARAACDPKQVWIVKPYAAYCGRGIFLLNNTGKLSSEVIEDRAVVSRYLERPYLINGLKFDMRIYVLVTSWHPLVIYLHSNGLVRFATEPYSLDGSLEKRNMHITNYTLNKRSSNFKASAAVDDDGTGSKWTLDALRAHLLADVGEARSQTVWAAVDDLVVKTCLAAEPSTQQSFEKYVPEAVRAQPHAGCFQLFGFDVMLDADLKPWLLEVNLDPALGTDSPLDFKVKSAMLTDALNLIGIEGTGGAAGHFRTPAHAAMENTPRLSPEGVREWRARAQVDGERARSRDGSWRRLLPGPGGDRYAPFFETGRDLNFLDYDP